MCSLFLHNVNVKLFVRRTVCFIKHIHPLSFNLYFAKHSKARELGPDTDRMVVPAGEVHDVDVLHGQHVAVLSLLEEQSHVLRHRLKVERQFGRSHEVLAVSVVT